MIYLNYERVNLDERSFGLSNRERCLVPDNPTPETPTEQDYLDALFVWMDAHPGAQIDIFNAEYFGINWNWYTQEEL